MALFPDSRSSLILALSAFVCSGCGDAGASTRRARHPVRAVRAALAPSAASQGLAQVEQWVKQGPQPARAESRTTPARAVPTRSRPCPWCTWAARTPDLDLHARGAREADLGEERGRGRLSVIPRFRSDLRALVRSERAGRQGGRIQRRSQNGDLTFLNRVDSGGAAPAFVAVDRSGKYVLIANYDAGTTRVFSMRADGGLGAPSDDKSPGMNSHMILTDPGNKFAFVMNKGSDTITQYAFDATNARSRPTRYRR